MKDKKLSVKVFKFVLIALFITFLTIFMSNKYGYFEYKKHQQVILTQEQIQQFEDDVRNGKNVDIGYYLRKNEKHYQNNLSRFGLNLSNAVSSIVKKGVGSIFEYIDKAINEKR